MSDSKKDKDRKAGEDGPRIKVNPVVTRPDFVDWMMGLWGPTQRVTRLEIRTLRNRGGTLDRLTPLRGPITYGPEAQPPQREETVALTNEIISLMQNNCNALRKPQLYGVIAYEHGSADDMLGVFTIHLKPKEDPRDGDHGDGDGSMMLSGMGEGDEMSFPPGPLGMMLKYSLMQNQQSLEDRRAFIKDNRELTRDVLDALVDMNEKKDKLIADVFDQRVRLMEAMEKLTSQAEDRRLKARWNEVGVNVAERGAEVIIGLLPPMINRMAGKEVVQTRTSIESVVLSNFIKSVTKEQAREAFGVQGNDESGNPLPRYANAIFTEDQGALFAAIAQCQAPPEKLDDFLPGGALAISMEQMQRAQALFEPAQLWPLGDLIQQRMKKKMEEAQSVQTNVPPASPKP